MDKSKTAYLYLAVLILLWASFPAVGKLLVAGLDNFQIMFFMTLVSTLTLFLIVLFQGKMAVVSSYRLKDYVTFAYMGGLGIFLYNLFSFGSLTMIPAQEYTIINYLWPVAAIIFASLVLEERLTFTKIASVSLSFFGIYVAISQGNLFGLSFSSPVGVLMALLGAISYGLFSILGKKQDYERVSSMMFYSLFSFIFSMLSLLAFSSVRLPSLNESIGLFWVGAIPNGICYVLWLLALKWGETSRMSIMIYLVPFVALVYIYLLVGERILLSSVIGLVMVVAGISLQFLKR